jgi:hypothetical protein
MTHHRPSITGSLRLFGSFAITYYGLLAIFSAYVLVYNRFLLPSDFVVGKNEYLSHVQTVAIVSGSLLINLSAITGLILLFLHKKSGLGVFGLSALLLIIYQIAFSGFAGWQKLVAESILLFIMLLINHHKTRLLSEKAGDEATENC